MGDQCIRVVFNKLKSIFGSPLFVIIFFALTSCKTDLPKLEQIELSDWAKDRYGCLGYRMGVIAPLEQQKEKILALSANDITRLLGKPDEIELYKRNQKLFYYYLNPAPACGKNTTGTPPLRLMIRLNAMERAKEILIMP